MRKIRINELARECEQPNSVILALLVQFGVTEKKTHSSSVDEDVADKIRRHFGLPVAQSEEQPEPAPVAAPAEAPPVPVAEAQAKEKESVQKQAPQPEEPQPAEDSKATSATGETEPPKREALPVPEPSSLRHAVRPPLRPPLARPGARPTEPPAAPEPPAPEPPPTPPAAPERPAVPAATIAPGRPAASITKPKPFPAPKPGQIISGPRQPLPGTTEPPRPPRPVGPRAPLPPPAPKPSSPPQLRPQAPVSRQPAPSQQTPGAPQARPFAGQPAARPVVPPRPDLVARLAQTRAVPGQPQPRPAGPPRPQSTPVPGQPIYKGPIRPGAPIVRPRPGAPLSRGRPLHPTTPLRPEPGAPPPTSDQARRAQERKRAAMAAERDLDREERLLRVPAVRRDEASKLAQGKQITVAEGITVKELSEKLGIKANLVIKKLVDRKIFATINQTLDVKLADGIAREFGASAETVSYEQEAENLFQAETPDDAQAMDKRPPVVTVMGHVDHGKTSLLDAIRESNVAEREAGGITQHIGAYHIEKNGRKIVFIDTPGHEAFTRMRARGAKVTDIVVLVVAADDGVMPQTLEAIDHAKAAGVPIIVAINKIDKGDAQPDRVKQQLSDRGLLPEEWGGETVMVPVSARNKQNLDLLLEMILLVADLQELKANAARPGVATVLEAKLDRGRGPVATVLVRNGTLNVGDYVISGSVFGKIRAMFDDRGQAVRRVGPSMPAEVIGLDALPEVGETLQGVTDTAKAKQIVVYRESKAREQAMARSTRLTLEQLHQQIKTGDVKELPVILKADVGGTAEVLGDALQKLSTDKVRIRVIHTGVGAITETDVLLASASNAIIIGFNVRPDRNATALAEKEKVDIRLHTIIYDLTDEIKRAMSGMLEPVFKEVYRGRAEVRDTFRITKVGTVAGCLVVDGVIPRTSEIRVLRDNVVVYTGKISSLKRFKDDVSEVKSGLECGISIENFNDVKPGDVLEAFVTERVAVEALA